MQIPLLYLRTTYLVVNFIHSLTHTCTARLPVFAYLRRTHPCAKIDYFMLHQALHRAAAFVITILMVTHSRTVARRGERRERERGGGGRKRCSERICACMTACAPFCKILCLLSNTLYTETKFSSAYKLTIEWRNPERAHHVANSVTAFLVAANRLATSAA
uniref:Putative secreted protein n=1 Tax=Anopheles marajoara TaxID=58244 RepID=A0A2M4C6M7_9DIPT